MEYQWRSEVDLYFRIGGPAFEPRCKWDAPADRRKGEGTFLPSAEDSSWHIDERSVIGINSPPRGLGSSATPSRMEGWG